MRENQKRIADAIGLSERKLREQLVELGVAVLLNEARRLQAASIFGQNRLLHENEPIPIGMVQQAHRTLCDPA